MGKSQRILYITGDIDFNNFGEFCEKLDEYEEESDETVYVRLASNGGDALAAHAFYSRIRLSPCEIHILGFGNVASAAVLILAAGDHRTLAREAWVMVHEDQGDKSGSVTDRMRENSHDMELEDQWAGLLAESTTTEASDWRQLHRATTYISPKECLKLGLIESII